MENLEERLEHFRQYYSPDHNDLMRTLAQQGQSPSVMVIACCDSRVDPAILLDCEPGEIFCVRNVANIIPPYQVDGRHHGTSAALEYAVQYLQVKDMIILGHSDCGGIRALLNSSNLPHNDFIGAWVNQLYIDASCGEVDQCARKGLIASYHNALSFPWLRERVQKGSLKIHVWYFDISQFRLWAYQASETAFKAIF